MRRETAKKASVQNPPQVKMIKARVRRGDQRISDDAIAPSPAHRSSTDCMSVKAGEGAAWSHSVAGRTALMAVANTSTRTSFRDSAGIRYTSMAEAQDRLAFLKIDVAVK